MSEDKRVRIEEALKETVLEPMSSKFGISMLATARYCASWAIQNELEPREAKKSITITGDVFAEEPLYKLVANLYNTEEPRRVAHELMNAGLEDLASKYEDADSLTELFGLEDVRNQ